MIGLYIFSLLLIVKLKEDSKMYYIRVIILSKIIIKSLIINHTLIYDIINLCSSIQVFIFIFTTLKHNFMSWRYYNLNCIVPVLREL